MPGILWGDDFDRLKESVIRVLEKFGRTEIVRFVEIGVASGDTSRDLLGIIRKWYDNNIPVFDFKHYHNFTYYGIDPLAEVPRGLGNEFFYLKWPSRLAIIRVPVPIHWVFVDGCHCAECVRSDMKLYSKKLAQFGEILFHDAAPMAQGRDPQDYANMDDQHDPIEAAKGIQVRKVLDSPTGPCPPNFLMIRQAPRQEYGGVEVYRKVV